MIRNRATRVNSNVAVKAAAVAPKPISAAIGSGTPTDILAKKEPMAIPGAAAKPMTRSATRATPLAGHTRDTAPPTTA
ncbi:hypothetical protein D3C72_1642620 [compost metagenome]